jgi:hypothetical protein
MRWTKQRVFLVLASSLFVASCSAGVATNFAARTDDERVTFTLEGETARSTLATFCGSHVDHPCDQFENYAIQVNVANDIISMTYVHRSAAHAAQPNHYPSILCRYMDSGFECYRGDRD